MTPKVYYRDATQEDVSFIFNSWLKSYRNSDAMKNIANSIYFTEHHKVIENILQTCKVTIACNPSDKSQIYGYIVFEHISDIAVIHYVYTKHTFRKMGIARGLMKQAKPDKEVAGLYTHSTKMGDRISPRYSCAYHPYIALTEEYRRIDEEIKEEKEDVEQAQQG